MKVIKVEVNNKIYIFRDTKYYRLKVYMINGYLTIKAFHKNNSNKDHLLFKIRVNDFKFFQIKQKEQ